MWGSHGQYPRSAVIQLASNRWILSETLPVSEQSAGQCLPVIRPALCPRCSWGSLLLLRGFSLGFLHSSIYERVSHTATNCYVISSAWAVSFWLRLDGNPERTALFRVPWDSFWWPCFLSQVEWQPQTKDVSCCLSCGENCKRIESKVF